MNDTPAPAPPAPATVPPPDPAPVPPPPPVAPQPPVVPPSARRRGGLGCLVAALVTVTCLGLFALVLGGVLLLAFTGERFLGGARPARLREEFVSGDLFAKSKIAVIDLRGLITSGTFYDGASAETVCLALETAAEDDAIKAVILDIDSPGGEITASDEIHQAVQRLRRDTGKPVVACMHAMGASGAYFVAAGADHIVANRLTITGSIGVIIPHYVYRDLLGKIGVRAEPYTSGDMKDMLSGARQSEPAKERAYVQALVMESFHEFAQVVADGREAYGSAESVAAAPFADGRILTGREAFKAGLVDELGYFEDAVATARDLGGAPGAKVVRLGRMPGLADLLFSAAGRAVPRAAAPWPEWWTRIHPGQPYYLLPTVLP